GLASLNAVHSIERHGLVRTLEDRRLVHVVPKAANAHRPKIRIKRAPPLANLVTRKIREYAFPGPYFAHVHRAVRVFHDVAVFDPLLVRLGPRDFGEVQIGDPDNLESFALQVGNHLLEGREALAINGEWPITLLIIDI